MGSQATDPQTTADAVLKAFYAAQEAGLPTPQCYRASVEVWRCLHPEHDPTYAARRAVSIVLEARTADMGSIAEAVVPGASEGAP